MFELQESPRRVLAAWVGEQLAETEVTSIFEPYAGDARLGGSLKRQGRQILANDPVACHYWWNKAVVENAGETLSLLKQGALQQPHADEGGFTGFTEWANRYFSDEEVGWLNRWYLNAAAGDLTDGERALFHAAVYWTMGYWLDHNQRYIQEKPLAPHEVLQCYIEQANGWVFDNGMPNVAYCGDPYDLTADMPTDALLLVAPPPAGWAQAPLRVRLWEGWTQGSSQAGLPTSAAASGPRLGQTLSDPQAYRAAIDALLAKAEAMPYWMITYQEGAPFTHDEWSALVGARRGVWRDVRREVSYPSAVGPSAVTEGVLVAVAG